MAIPSLTNRYLAAEVMDDPALPPDQLQRALTDLARLNRISRSAEIVWPAVARAARSQPGAPLRVLDIATGSGDIPLALYHRAKRHGLELDIAGIDINPYTVEMARRSARQAGAAIEFQCFDALGADLPAQYDVVFCSLFLHHLPTDTAVELLRRMAAAARRLILVSDLRRDLYGLALAYSASRIFSRSAVVHTDAVLSVRAAFTPQELAQMAARAGLARVQIVRRWPARMLLTAAP